MPDTIPNLGAIADQARLAVQALSALAADDSYRADGALQNALLKFGRSQGMDIEQWNTVARICQLNRTQLEDLFAEDAYAQRVCTTNPEAMAAGGFTVTGLSDKALASLEQWRDSTGLIGYFKDASVMANIYDRGAAVVLGVDDGLSWDQPVNTKAIKSVVPLFVKSGYTVQPNYSLLSQPTSYVMHLPQIDKEFELIAPTLGVEKPDALINKLKKGVTTSIHPDRVLWFDGIWIPEDADIRREGSPSLLQMFWRHYSRYEMGMKIAVNLMARISVVHFQREGWLELLNAQDESSQQKINRQIEVLQQSLHNSGVVFSDLQKNKVEIITRSLAEVASILDRLFEQMLGASGLSKRELTGRNDVSGLADNSLQDRMDRANKVTVAQKNNWLKPLNKVVGYWIAANVPGQSKPWAIEFPTTLKLTESEEMQAAVQLGQAWLTVVQAQIFHPSEARKALAGHPIYKAGYDANLKSPAEDQQAQQIEQLQGQIAELEAALGGAGDIGGFGGEDLEGGGADVADEAQTETETETEA